MYDYTGTDGPLLHTVVHHGTLIKEEIKESQDYFSSERIMVFHLYKHEFSSLKDALCQV